jgi:hypothetical protein
LEQVQGSEVEWTLGFAFSSQQQKDEGEEEGKGQEGKKEEEKITPVYREVLGAVFDGAAVSQQEQGTTTTTTTLDSYGLTIIAATMKKIAAAASKALRTLLLQLWDSARAALIESRRWINAAMSKITRRN